MSLYSTLSINVPVINYAALHQMKKGTDQKEYVKTIHDMHRAIRSETDRIVEAWKNHRAELTASSVQSMRGALSQFLTLPLDGDVKEIQRILEDQISRLFDQAVPPAKPGIVASVEGRFVWERDQNSLLQSMLTHGKEYLKKMKFKTRDDDGHIFESDFVVEGGMNLDIIEHIVRDRMGIYATAHGQHIQQSEPFVFAAHNLVFLDGPLERADAKVEGVVHFSKGRPQYTPFRKELVDMIKSAQSEFQLHHCSLWQHKLGLGAGTEFHMRLRGADRKSVREFVVKMSKVGEKSAAFSPLFKNGYLLFKELTA